MQISAITVLLSILSLTAAIATPQADSSVVQLKPRANPVPDCSLNGGKALCCQGTFAGDIPLIVALAGLAQFSLNPNDINCIGTSPASPECVGVNTCCQATGLNPLVALYCEKPVGC